MKFVLSFFLVLCFASAGYAQCSIEEGREVGCQLAYEANAAGCNSIKCSAAALAIIRESSTECPEYVQGVKEGFRNCNGMAAPGTGPGVPPGPGTPIGPRPSRDCIWTGFEWACP